jgi:ABC-type nitrate/sulfonate/bicarbonate transport system substrate-binding protein
MNRSEARLMAMLGALALACIRPAVAQTAPPVDVNFGLNAPGAANWIYYIADRQGFFRDEGLNVQTVTSGTPTNTVNLLASGGVQVALDGSDDFIEAIVHGLPIKIVAPEWGPSPYVLLTQPSISTWDQLMGKSVLLGPKGDVSSITFTLLAEQRHLRLSDFSVVPGSTSSARYAGLLSGHVGGTVLSQPFSVLALQKGMHPLATAADVVKDWLDTCFAVNTNWATTHRSTVVRMMRALRKALDYGYSHPDGAIATLIAETHIAADTAAAVYDLDFRRQHVFDPKLRMNVKGLMFMAQLARQDGMIDAVPAPSELFDPSFVEAAGQPPP